MPTCKDEHYACVRHQVMLCLTGCTFSVLMHTHMPSLHPASSSDIAQQMVIHFCCPLLSSVLSVQSQENHSCTDLQVILASCRCSCRPLFCEMIRLFCSFRAQPILALIWRYVIVIPPIALLCSRALGSPTMLSVGNPPAALLSASPTTALFEASLPCVCC
jgi:hypothetical protein